MRTVVSWLALSSLLACADVRDRDARPDLGASDAESLRDANAAADGGNADAGTQAEAERLCDGSADVRLLYTTMGGELDFTWEFTNPYGLSFLAVDGRCRFYASSDFQRGIASGVLTADDEGQLSEALHFGELGAWAALPDQRCANAGQERLGRVGAVETCWCGCDADAPDRADALESAYGWTLQLETRGEPLTGPVSAMAQAQSYADADDRSVTWPLDRRMSSIANLVLKPAEFHPRVGTYARFEAAADSAALRSLRSERANARGTSGSFFVREDAKIYDLYVRDELPVEIAESLETLRQSWPQP